MKKSLEQAQVIEVHGKSFLVMPTRNISFWELVKKGNWEPNTFIILEHFLSQNCIYLDVGCWIGPTALYSSQIAKHTYAFEPDPVAYQELELNKCANKDADWITRLSLRHEAIAPTSGAITIGNCSHGGDSTSSILFSDQKTHWTVKATTIQQFLRENALQNEALFIKIDIEGGEYDLIPAIKDCLVNLNIKLYLSLHPDFLMSSLIQGKNTTLLRRISKRFLLAWRHIELIRSLPFHYIYRSDGRRVNLYLHIPRVLLRASFPREIVATNTKWDEKA